MLTHQAEGVGERGVGVNGDRIDDHAGDIALHRRHLLRLNLRCHIAVDDADAALPEPWRWPVCFR